MISQTRSCSWQPEAHRGTPGVSRSNVQSVRIFSSPSTALVRESAPEPVGSPEKASCAGSLPTLSRWPSGIIVSRQKSPYDCSKNGQIIVGPSPPRIGDGGTAEPLILKTSRSRWRLRKLSTGSRSQCRSVSTRCTSASACGPYTSRRHDRCLQFEEQLGCAASTVRQALRSTEQRHASGANCGARLPMGSGCRAPGTTSWSRRRPLRASSRSARIRSSRSMAGWRCEVPRWLARRGQHRLSTRSANSKLLVSNATGPASCSPRRPADRLIDQRTSGAHTRPHHPPKPWRTTVGFALFSAWRLSPRSRASSRPRALERLRAAPPRCLCAAVALSEYLGCSRFLSLFLHAACRTSLCELQCSR